KPPFPLLALPWAAQADMHYYRTDVYQQAGLKPPETFDELLENARKLNKPPERYGFGLRAADNVGFTLNVMNYLQMNGVLVTDGKGGTGLDGPEALRTVKDLAQLYYDGVAQPSALQDRFPQMVALFQTGKIAQWSASVNHSVLLVGADKKFDEVTGVTLMP